MSASAGLLGSGRRLTVSTSSTSRTCSNAKSETAVSMTSSSGSDTAQHSSGADSQPKNNSNVNTCYFTNKRRADSNKERSTKDSKRNKKLRRKRRGSDVSCSTEDNISVLYRALKSDNEQIFPKARILSFNDGEKKLSNTLRRQRLLLPRSNRLCQLRSTDDLAKLSSTLPDYTGMSKDSTKDQIVPSTRTLFDVALHAKRLHDKEVVRLTISRGKLSANHPTLQTVLQQRESDETESSVEDDCAGSCCQAYKWGNIDKWEFEASRLQHRLFTVQTKTIVSSKNSMDDDLEHLNSGDYSFAQNPTTAPALPQQGVNACRVDLSKTRELAGGNQESNFCSNSATECDTSKTPNEVDCKFIHDDIIFSESFHTSSNFLNQCSAENAGDRLQERQEVVKSSPSNEQERMCLMLLLDLKTADLPPVPRVRWGHSPNLPASCGEGSDFTEHELNTFFQLIEEDALVSELLRRDTCRTFADKYQLAMVFIYFLRAGLKLSEYDRLHFLGALYLAHDIEEEDDSLKCELLHWMIKDLSLAAHLRSALSPMRHIPSNCRCCTNPYESFRLHWLRQAVLAARDKLFWAMECRAIVSQAACHTVMLSRPEHIVWLRSRPPHHGFSYRECHRKRIIRGHLYLKRPHDVPVGCPLCKCLHHAQTGSLAIQKQICLLDWSDKIEMSTDYFFSRNSQLSKFSSLNGEDYLRVDTNNNNKESPLRDSPPCAVSAMKNSENTHQILAPRRAAGKRRRCQTRVTTENMLCEFFIKPRQLLPVFDAIYSTEKAACDCCLF